MQFLCASATQLVDQPCTTFNSAVGSEIHHQRPQPVGFSHIGWSEHLQTNYKVRETSLVPYKHNRKTKRCLAHFCFLPKSTCLSGRWTRPSVSSCFNHLRWTKPRRKKKGYGVQTGTTSDTKVTRLECKALLGKGMDLNSFTWLLVTCVLFQMYITPALIQSACSSGDVTTWHPDQIHLLIFNTLHFILSVGGRRYHVIWLKLFLIHLEVHQFLKKQLQPSTNLRSWIVENPIHQVLQTHFPTPFHVFPTTLSLWGTISPRRKKTRSQTC